MADGEDKSTLDAEGDLLADVDGKEEFSFDSFDFSRVC